MRKELIFEKAGEVRFGKIVKFIIPTYLTALFTTLYTIVDGIFVSAYVGTDALAAVNIVYPMINILTGTALIFAVGGSSWAAIYLGRKENETANQLFMFCVKVNLAVGIFISVIIWLCLHEILQFSGATRVTEEYCEIYIKIWLAGTAAVMLKEVFVYFIRADGRPGYSFAISAAGGILNIILDYIFVGKMALGIWGAGVATILGLLLSTVLGILYFVKFSTNLRFTMCRIRWKFLLPCIGNGSSEFINQIAIAITTVVFNKTALSYAGDDGVAAVSIIMYVQFIFLGIYTGYSMGISPLLGYNYGNKNREVCRKLENISYKFLCGIPAVLYAAAFLLAPFAVACFAGKGSYVYDLGVRGVRIYSIGYFFAGISIFTAVRFTSYGKGQYAAIITALRSFLLLLVFLFILPGLFGMDGIWMSVPSAEAVTVTVTIIMVLSEPGKHRNVWKCAK